MTVINKVSVILTSYNHSKYIEQAIESVLAQDYSDFELIIIDDCSNDNSSEIIKKYHDKRIKFIQNQVNLGMVSTVNKAIKLSKGEYIAHINSDDLWEDKTKLTSQVKFLDENSEFAACFTKVKLINDKGKEIKDTGLFSIAKNQNRYEWLRQFFLHGNCLCYPSSMIRKQAFEEVGFYDPRYALLLDFDMWIKICKKYEIHILGDNYIKFRMGGASSDNVNLGDYEFIKALENYLTISFEDFKKVFLPKVTNINQNNYIIFLLIVSFSISRSHLKFALENIRSYLKNGDFSELNFTYKDFIKYTKLIANNKFFDAKVKSRSHLAYTFEKLVNFDKFLEYKKYKISSKKSIEESLSI